MALHYGCVFPAKSLDPLAPISEGVLGAFLPTLPRTTSIVRLQYELVAFSWLPVIGGWADDNGSTLYVVLNVGKSQH